MMPCICAQNSLCRTEGVEKRRVEVNKIDAISVKYLWILEKHRIGFMNILKELSCGHGHNCIDDTEIPNKEP
jgi:hypothetical protein